MSNTTKTYFSVIFIGILLFGIQSCGNSQHTPQQTQKLKKKSDRELKKALFNQNEIPFHFFIAPISVDYNSTTLNQSFSTYLKLNVDTMFGGTIKKGFVAAGIYKVTTDSVYYANKLNKCYFAENLTYISSLFGTTIEYDFFQDLILGLPIGLDEKAKYQQIPVDDHYILSTHKEKDYRKLENDRLNVKDDVMLVQYHMDRESLDLTKILIEIPSDTTSIRINYLEKKEVDGYIVPEETTVEIVNPSDSIFINLNYGSVKINDRKEIKIRIPESYSECK